MDSLVVAGQTYSSRLLVGTGKYKDFAQTRAAVEASGAEIVTVAIRRTNIGQNPGEPSLLEALPPSRFTILPNTAGCYGAGRGAHAAPGAGAAGWTLARESSRCWAIPHAVSECSGNARRREDAGERRLPGHGLHLGRPDHRQAAGRDRLRSVMPLASLIGSGMGVLNPWNLRSSSTTRRSRCWWMRVWARPPTRLSPWSWVATVY